MVVRRALVAAVVALALSVGGCTPSPQPTPSATATSWTEHGPITLAIGSDPSGAWAQVLSEWNTSHPDEQVTLRELPSDPRTRHDTVAGLARAKSGELTVIAVDPTWVAEFADNHWLAELPAADFPTTGLLARTVTAATRSDALYAYPVSADAGVLYYRADLLAAAGQKAPTTWAELTSICQKVLPATSSMSCYGLALGESESLTVNVAEAITSAGGDLTTPAGTPDVASTSATLGVRWLAGGLKDGSIPADALNWTDEAARQAFSDGRLLFLRDWTYAESPLTTNLTGSRVGVAQLPGRTGAGVPVAGGVSLGISTWARNQATAAEFIRWVASEPIQRELLEKGSIAPARESVYDDSDLSKTVPHVETVAAAVRSARSLPVTPKYQDVSAAVQTTVRPVLKGDTDADEALKQLQAQLEDLLK